LFTPSRDFNADDVIFSFDRQRIDDNPFNAYVEGAAGNISTACRCRT
jgi:dipeptide transport system substrate-binding protein